MLLRHEKCQASWPLEERNSIQDQRQIFATVHGLTKSQTWLRDFVFNFHSHALEKEMATHSNVLAWKTPGMAEPGGLPSMGSHRVGHDWSDLASSAAAAGVIMKTHFFFFMRTQNFKRNLFLILYIEGKNFWHFYFVSSCLLRGIKNCLMLAAYFLHLETPNLPAC